MLINLQAPERVVDVMFLLWVKGGEDNGAVFAHRGLMGRGQARQKAEYVSAVWAMTSSRGMRCHGDRIDPRLGGGWTRPELTY